MFTYKKHSIHRNSSAMVIYFNMVTDIKQTRLGQGLGVTFTARKRPCKLMLTMKDVGHTLPGCQNSTLILQVTVDDTIFTLKKKHANHSVKQLSKFAKLAYIQKGLFPSCGLSRVTQN